MPRDRDKPRKRKNEITDLTIYDHESNEPIVYKKEVLEAIRNTVAKKATMPELFMFMSLANEYGLSPFKREIWFIKFTSDGAPRIETGRDGYATICRRDPGFIGYTSEVVRENDEFQIDYELGEVKNITHKFTHKDRGPIVGVWGVAKHETKPSVWTYLPIEEIDKGTPIWKDNPTLMCRKVAESTVLKRMGGISGLVTAEEMGTDPKLVTKRRRPDVPDIDGFDPEEEAKIQDAEYEVKGNIKPTESEEPEKEE